MISPKDNKTTDDWGMVNLAAIYGESDGADDIVLPTSREF